MQPASSILPQVEIFISCRNLKDKDICSKSDPQVFCNIMELQGQWLPAGQTEHVQNNLNPDFTQTIVVNYQFEVDQKLHFIIYDIDGSNKDLLGQAFSSVGQIMGARNSTVILDLTDKNNNKIQGKLILRGESVAASKGNDFVSFSIKATKVADKDFFSKSDPFLAILRAREDMTWDKVHETEHIDDNLNPIWKPFRVSLRHLCNGDVHRPLKLQIMDYDSNGKHDYIGEIQTSLNELLQKPTLQTKDMKDKKQKFSGNIHIVEACIYHEPDFLEFIEGNCFLNFMVAIDFTGSNGQQSNPSSLHFLNPSAPNEYERAIMSVGGILEQYDCDRYFPVWGFGCSIKGQPVTHCFPLTYDPQNPFVTGVQGILGLYRARLPEITFSGPTLFSSILKETIRIAQMPWAPGSQNYNVLMILTDGEIHDMKETIELIVQASRLPLSIIIVGVGSANFALMEQLDCDKGSLTDCRGNKAVRDIVQFVPFRNLQGNAAMLAKQVLAEVPKQLTGFMKSCGIQPFPRPVVQLSQISIEQPKPQLSQTITLFFSLNLHFLLHDAFSLNFNKQVANVTLHLSVKILNAQ